MFEENQLISNININTELFNRNEVMNGISKELNCIGSVGSSDSLTSDEDQISSQTTRIDSSTKLSKKGSNKSKKNKNTSKVSGKTNDFKTKWKTEICHFWNLNGYCRFGENVYTYIIVVCICPWRRGNEI